MIFSKPKSTCTNKIVQKDKTLPLQYCAVLKEMNISRHVTSIFQFHHMIPEQSF